MLKDLFINVTIGISFLFVINQLFRAGSWSRRLLLKNKALLGLLFGVMGLTLIYFSIKAGSDIRIDLRNLAIVSAGIMGGPLTAILSAALIALSRLLIYGLTRTSIIALISILMVGLLSAMISAKNLARVTKFLLSLMSSMVVSTLTLMLLQTDRKLTETLFWYWLLHGIGAFVVYLEMEFFKRAQESIRTMDHYKAMADNLLDMLSTHKPDGSFIYISPSVTRLLGYEPETLLGDSPYRHIHPDDAKRVHASHVSLVSHNSVSFQTYRMRRKDGSYIWVESIVRSILNEEGAAEELIATTRDVTGRKRLERTLLESEERFRKAFDNAPIGMCLQSIEGNYIKVNQVLCDIVGYSEEELLRMNYKAISHQDDLDLDTEQRRRLLAGEISYYHFEKRYHHKNGSVLWVLVGLSLLNDSENNFQYYIVQIEDITDKKLALEELRLAKQKAELIARTDHLTGIMNRRAFEERLIEECCLFGRTNRPLCVILADIDHFKTINDTYGHQGGDQVLKAFVKTLEKACRPYDFIGRLGGEEFIIGLPGTTMDQALQIAERMRKSVESRSILLHAQAQSLRLTASFGVASVMEGRIHDAAALIAEADKAMYKAKEERNRVCAA